MKFLTKLGQILAKGTEIFLGFAPLLQQNIPNSANVLQTVSKDLTEIGNIIVQVEAMGQALNLPGAQKLLAAAPVVQQIILSSALLANHKINDEALFHAGCTKVADGMADVLNSFHDDITTVSKT